MANNFEETQLNKHFGGTSKYWVYLTNLGLYNEGFLVGVYLHFPFTEEDLEEAMRAILISDYYVTEEGYRYEEYFISDYDAPFKVGEYEPILEVSEHYDAISPYLDYPEEVIQVIDAHQSDNFTLIELSDAWISDNEKLGLALEEEGYITIPEELYAYINFEKVGRDFSIESDGYFIRNYYLLFN